MTHKYITRKTKGNIDLINNDELNKLNYKCKFKLKEPSTTSACLYVAQCLPDDMRPISLPMQ